MGNQCHGLQNKLRPTDRRERGFLGFLGFRDGIPRHDTLGDVLARIPCGEGWIRSSDFLVSDPTSSPLFIRTGKVLFFRCPFCLCRCGA